MAATTTSLARRLESLRTLADHSQTPAAEVVAAKEAVARILANHPELAEQAQEATPGAITTTRPAKGGAFTEVTYPDGDVVLTYTDQESDFSLTARLRPRAGGYRRVCDVCDGTNFRPEYAGLYEGTCFPCKGTGMASGPATLAQQRYRLRKRVTGHLSAQATREREYVERQQQAQEQRATMLAAHPEFATALAEFEAAVEAAASTRAEHLAEFPGCHPAEADAVRRERAGRKVNWLCWEWFLDFRSVSPRRCNPERFVAEWRQTLAEPEAVYVGEVGAKTTVTGTVAVVRSFETQWGYSCLFVLEGTGEHAGATVKWFSSARWLDEVNEGDTLTVTGTVKAHEDDDEYGKQTLFTRPRRG